jgi:hypothetical protein
MEDVAAQIAKADLFDSTSDGGDGTLFVVHDGKWYFITVALAENQDDEA